MTAVDRAFIKAYTARRPARGTSANVAAAQQRFSTAGEASVDGGTPSYRVDGAHAAAVAPHTRSAPRKSRRPSAEHADQDSTEQTSAPQTSTRQAPATIERAGRGERVVFSLSESAIPLDWIWQREPNPVFAESASTAAPVEETRAAKLPPAEAPAAPSPPSKSLSSKVLSPEILSLGLPAAGAAAASASAVATAPAAGAAAANVAAQIAAPPIAASQSNAATKTAATKVPASAVAVSGPLSSFTVVPRIEDRLQPALEVDQFLWPPEIAELGDAAAAELDAFVTQLMDGARRGQRRIGLVGTTPAAGTTTVGLCLARLARAKGGTWGLLDADFDHAALAPRLGIAQAAGWQAVLSGRERLADVSISSLDDHLVLVPLAADGPEPCELAANFRAPVLFSMLADIVDLVLVDAGAVAGESAAGGATAGGTTATSEQQRIDRLAALARAARLDAVYLVYDERSTTRNELTACASRLRAAGVFAVGAIANFAAL